jgi:hypothetical protein
VVTRDKADRSDISELGLWNSAKKSDKAGVTRDKVERPHMSGLGADMSRLDLYNPDKKSDKAEGPDMSDKSL